MDLFDYKPELVKHNGKSANLGRDSAGAKLLAPVHPFGQYGSSGLWMTSLYPNLARHADDLCVINSMNTDLPLAPVPYRKNSAWALVTPVRQ